MNFVGTVLIILVGVTWAQDNFTENTPEEVATCRSTAAAPKTLEKIATETRGCISRYFSVDDVKERIEVGRNNDILDIVSEEFCLVKSVIRRCVKQSLPEENPCLGDDEQESLRLILNITESILNFVCHKNGDRIMLFLTEGGFECIESNTKELQKCFSDAIGDSNVTDLTSANVYHLINNVTICTPYDNLQECVFHVLQNCTTVTPANMANSLFENIKSFSICGTVQ